MCLFFLNRFFILINNPVPRKTILLKKVFEIKTNETEQNYSTNNICGKSI